VPEPFESTHRRAPRLGLALLEFVNCSLRQANTPAQFGLAPAENRTDQPDFSCKGMPLEADNLAEIIRLSSKMNCHRAIHLHLVKRKALGSFPPRAFVSNTHDHAIKDRSRDGHGTGTPSCPRPSVEQWYRQLELRCWGWSQCRRQPWPFQSSRFGVSSTTRRRPCRSPW
jgi:hypothetical protein